MAPAYKLTLSIAVLTYKHEAYIRQALDGVFMQKVNFNYEIVIADDCSPDGTREIIQEYIDRYPQKNIRTIFHSQNVGMWQNVMVLLNSLEGKYFAFIEGDDYWTDENKLQQQVDFLEAHPDYVCCFHAAKVIKETASKNALTFTRYPQNPVAETTGLLDILRDGNYIPTASMVQRNVFKGNFPTYIGNKHGYPDTMIHLLHASQGKYRYLDKEMSVYRINVGGITETKSKIREYEAKVFMVEASDEFTQGKWHKEHRIAIQKSYYRLLNNFRKIGDKKKIKHYLHLIQQNKAFDPDYHPNFMRKVWLEEFVPGAKSILRLLGK